MPLRPFTMPVLLKRLFLIDRNQKQRSGALDVSAAKLLEQMLAGTQSERHDADGGGLVRAVEEDACVAGVKVRYVVRLPESVGNEFLRIVTHTAGAGIVKAPAGNIRRIARAFDHAPSGTEQTGADLLRVFPHFQNIFVPLKMNACARNAVGVFDFRIDVHKVRVQAQRWSLNRETDRRWIASLDLALVGRAKTLCARRVPRVFATASSGINGVAPNEFLFVGIFQVLPARHPDDGVVADTIWKTGLTQKLRKIAVRGFSVKVVAEIASELAAGIGNSRGPMTRLGIEPDACGFDIRCSHNDRAA